MTVTPHHLTFIFNSFNTCPFCQTTEKLKEIKTAKDKAMHKGDTNDRINKDFQINFLLKIVIKIQTRNNKQNL
jgi:hypothetical protein